MDVVFPYRQRLAANDRVAWEFGMGSPEATEGTRRDRKGKDGIEPMLRIDENVNSHNTVYFNIFYLR